MRSQPGGKARLVRIDPAKYLWGLRRGGRGTLKECVRALVATWRLLGIIRGEERGERVKIRGGGGGSQGSKVPGGKARGEKVACERISRREMRASGVVRRTYMPA